MSHRAIYQAIGRINEREILLFPSEIASFQLGLENAASIGFEQGNLQMLEARGELMNTYGGSSENAKAKPFAFANGLAVIPIHGSLINRFSSSYGSVTGYNFIRSQLRAALADPDVIAIVFDVNSPGGEAAGCFELATEIRESRAVKPSLAMVDTMCASAAYALASSATKMSVVRSATVGSIGVLVMHIDVSGFLESHGIKISLLHSGKHKVDGNPFSELSEQVRADIQTNIDELRSDFVDEVAANRNLDKQVVFDTEAQVYRGKKAVTIGLADEVATVQDAVSAFMTTALSGAPFTTLEQSDMTQPATTAAPVVPAADAAASVDAATIRAAEKERCHGIMGLAEAKDNPGLAEHLAFNTDMSVEAAKATLTSSKPAVAADTTTNPLATAMNSATNGQPVVEPGAEATAAAGSTADILAQFDRANYQATGRKKADAA